MSVSPRCQLLVEGYLDVKTPPDSPERILYKAWRRQFVSATAYFPAGRGEPHLILLVSRTPEDQPSNKKQVKASRDGLRLFRCRSGSRPLQTWALTSGSSLLLYLAAKTELETQRWMAAIRDGLWPPIMVENSQTGTTHEVSLIDDEKSFTSGLLGVYGRLVHTSEDVICVIHPYWQGIHMRWRLDDILDVRLIRTVEKDNTAGVFHIALRSTMGDTRTLLFYSNTATTTIEWIRSLLQAMKSDPKPTSSKVNSSPSPIQSDKTNCISETNSEYAIVQKTETDEKLNVEKQTENDIPSDIEKEAKLLGTSSMNIPNGFLDASMSSSMFGQAKMDKSQSTTDENDKVNGHVSGTDSEGSSGEVYEHLYEDLDIPKEARSYTVYEEVDDGAEEYVPPMPVPPSLPKRQPATQHQVKTLEPGALRLQKLCESVTEALKQAEETPVLTVENSELLQKQKSQKKKKKYVKPLVKHESLRCSPKLDDKLSAVVQSESAGDLKRSVSDSEIKKVSIDGCDLPLLPFNYRADSDTSNKKELRSGKPNHLPLQDILKNLKAASARGKIGSRNSELNNISNSASDGVQKSSSRSEETEAQYLDMS